MLGALTLIFSCQLAGELLVAVSGLPVPGPVVGMVLLLGGLIVRGDIPEPLADVGGALLSNLALLFVPAGVGVMLHVALIGREALPITVALVVSTAATVAVTALVMNALQRSEPGGEESDGGEAR
ncbi:CidA/LrgA family protein [Rhizobiales bacterium]|uniref:CidA/LrgA family protein n=1 Tax=Hongsoonwoonella zoysiae TaxID=2821844 RepID=UPI001560CCD1|nr:CidA/LrgA family protein [Hongsoonwoonella zoysiae]NRG18091.1 CidA/LrgA family protein [Hongsoonwoonella zoysiae]